MDEIIFILNSGNYSCVIKNGEETRTFSKRGVADLYDLLNEDKSFLENAMIADKVVGKAALALMIYGGVKELHAEVISAQALELLKSNNSIKISYTTEVPHIINRTQTDWCPLEKLCFEEQSIEKMYEKINEFITKMRASK